MTQWERLDAVEDEDGQPSAELAALRQEVADLHAALASRPVIDQAKGILMARYGTTADQSFSILRRWSQTHNVKVRVLAEALVRAASELDVTGDSRGASGSLLLPEGAALMLVDSADTAVLVRPDSSEDAAAGGWRARSGPRAEGFG